MIYYENWKDLEISPTTKIVAVIGDPISHSLSPKIHNYLLKKHQIDGFYFALKVKNGDLANCVQHLSKIGLKGFNVTIPHKEEIFRICHNKSKTALKVKAVNTVVIMPNGHLFGHNSDGEGFINNIKKSAPNFNFKGKNIVILGAGGATRAIYFALLKEKVDQITLTNRSIDKAKILIDDFKQDFPDISLKIIDWNDKEKALEDCDLLINCTSLGMSGQESLNIDLKTLNNSAIVTDIVYKPLMTDLLIEAEKRGNKIVTGIGMLVNQALVGFELWFGVKPQSDEELDKILLESLMSN